MNIVVRTAITATCAACLLLPLSVRAESNAATQQKTVNRERTYKVLLKRMLEQSTASKLSAARFENLVDTLYNSVMSPMPRQCLIVDLEAIKGSYGPREYYSPNDEKSCVSKYGVTLSELTILYQSAIDLRKQYWNYQMVLDEYTRRRSGTTDFLSQLQPQRMNLDTLGQLSDYNNGLFRSAQRLIDAKDQLRNFADILETKEQGALSD
jgi:hypothetical protein